LVTLDSTSPGEGHNPGGSFAQRDLIVLGFTTVIRPGSVF